MARERMVTRTVTKYVYEVMGIDADTAEVTITTRTLSEKLDSEKALKAINKAEITAVKFAVVKSVTEETVLMGMTEADFIRFATVLPPRTGAADET